MPSGPAPADPRRRQTGYALLVLVIVLALASLSVIMTRLDAAQYRRSRAQETAFALQSARSALLGHALTFRDLHDTESFGYLPCPDTLGNGVEQPPCGKGGETALGLLPYKTLDLPELRDGEGNCLWYAVSGAFKSNPKTFPFNWDSQGQISVLDSSGKVLAAPDDGNGGVAAVVIAPGPALAGQDRHGRGSCGDPAQAAAYVENAGNNFRQAAGTAIDGTAGANDRLAWITSKEIFDGVVRRADFAAYMDEGIDAMRSVLGTQKATTGNALPTKNPFGRPTAHYNFYESWRDQFRYFRCATRGCYADGQGNHHDAILLFAGRRADGHPRPTTARTATDYFEAALPMVQGKGAIPCDPNPTDFDNTSADTRATDMVLCLPLP